MYGPNQVGELIIGNTAASEATIQTFIATAADKSLKVLSDSGVAVAANVPFKLLQKTAGDAGKGLNYEFSDVIDPKYVDKVTLKAYAPEVQKTVAVVGFTGNVLPNTTYAVSIRLYNESGSLSTENFAIITGYYATGSSVAGITDVIIRDGVLNSLRKNLIRRGDFEFVTATTAGPVGFTIAGKVQNYNPGKINGRMIEFDVTPKTYQTYQDLAQPQQNLNLLTSSVTVVPSIGSGTAKQIANYEWFVKGNKYEVYRTTGYPVDFNTPYYTDRNGVYNVINVIYFNPRKETSVERQYKVLTIAVNKGTDTLANNAATNTILTSIRTAVGTNAVVPANLAVV
jgi:hypothetical protein